MLLQKSQRLLPQVRAGKDAESIHAVGRDRPNAVKLADWQRFDEGGAHRRRYDKLPIGFAMIGRELGEKLVVGNASGCGKSRLLEDARSNFRRRRGCRRNATKILRHVEIGFVEREWFDQRRI